MPEKLKVSAVLPASPKEVFEAWLDSKAHGSFTGGKAKIAPKVGGAFTAWDDYISGTTLSLEKHKRIVQSWRTAEFPDGSPDSELEVLLAPVKGGTKITLVHTEI
ncbi:MAG: SRPBCC domain-containing protein, partial [Spirochaetota bacterium]